MADPLSIAGLVTGVISLGLQVAGGLSNYLDAVKGRTEELGSARRQATEMKELLLTIKDLLPQVENTFPKSAIMIKRHVNSCEAELSKLHALLSKLSQPSPSSTGIRLKLSEQKQKLTYPFNRSHISRLEERLTKVNNTLQTALQVTGLEISMNSASQIRQVHDLVISISQSQIVRTQSTSLIATRRDPEQTANSGPVIPLESMETAISLASKPSLLSSSMETLERCNTLQAPRSKWFTACSCPIFRKTSYQRSSWGSFTFSSGTSTTRKHLPDCPLSQIDGGTQATKFAVEFTGLRKLFQTAFVLSFFNTHGAGGRSLTPNFTYYPTVDERTAPAFRILRLPLLVIHHDPEDKVAKAMTLRCCLNSIFTLYSRKKASPQDIDSTGQSIMHLAVNIVRWAEQRIGNGFCINELFPVMTNLISCGVPVTTYNYGGITPSACALEWRSEENMIADLARLLLPVESDIPLAEGRGGRSYERSPLASLLRDSKLAEASGCGPLSLAARAGDDRLVQDLLKRYPQSLGEINHFGQGPLYFAIKHPLCLRLILEAGGVSLLERVDNYNATPLLYAYILDCRLSITILLASGSRITEKYVREVYQSKADESVVDEVLAALRQRREELKVLALENLTTTEAQSLGLHENKVLDGNAFEVHRLLLERGVDVPSRLYIGDDRGSYRSVYSMSYYFKRTVTMCDKLWALGFRDVTGDACTRFWWVPLLWHDHHDVEAVRWLIEHGADYWTPLSERSDRTEAIAATLAHFLANHFGRTVYSRLSEAYSDTDSDADSDADSETRRWILEKLMQVRVGDTCTCPCSLGGCTPLTAFISGLDHDEWDEIQFPAQQGFLVQILLTNPNENDLIAAVRRMTFDALGLTHTCCDFNQEPWDYKTSRHTPEEAEEINSEQSTLLDLFADLLIELDEIAHEDRGGVPLIVHDPEEFWMNRWLPLITEKLDNLDGDDLTEEERSAAKAIGVVWGPRPAEVVQEEPDEPDEPEWGSPEWAMKKLENIMSE
ncbi:hypothetical protein F5Y01DRAFT_312221 [Xylaria sp. FL0043]|nr:hypothetical protein F5Y01DRAFT_312221 [Xylaria sp. FL0043]